MDESTYVGYLLSCTCITYGMRNFVVLQGCGTYVYSNSAVYEGGWSEDQRAGWGKMNYENGDVYEGQWMKDKRHGLGVIRYGEKQSPRYYFYY